MKPANSILSAQGTTIFTVMSALAVEHGAINLGQGFPDEDGPEAVRRVAAEALLAGPNQYPPMMGLPELRQAVARHNQRFYGLAIDWQTQVMVTSGATEALTAAILGLVEPGDEVVLIEPLYDSYLPMVRRAGGIAKLVRLEPPHWSLPRAALEAAMSPKTKLLILNSPHNPCGKVLDQDELLFISELLTKNDAYALCDEVYEHLIFDGRRHVPLMTLPGMAERCLRVGSAGKTFSVTGWKVGYVTGAPHLITACAKAHQFLTFTTPPDLQKAVAFGLGLDDDYFIDLANKQQGKRDRLAAGLKRAGLDVLPSKGSYFLVADLRSIGVNEPDDVFCKRMTVEGGVAAVPISAFYDGQGVDHFIRFCFCKRDEVLDAAIERLTAFCRASLTAGVGGSK